jgi:hypothetical protein
MVVIHIIITKPVLYNGGNCHQPNSNGVHLNWWNPIVIGLNPVGGNLGTRLQFLGSDGGGKGDNGSKF